MSLGKIAVAVVVTLGSVANAMTPAEESNARFSQNRNAIIRYVMERGQINQPKWENLIESSGLNEGSVKYLRTAGNTISSVAAALDHLEGATLKMGPVAMGRLDAIRVLAAIERIVDYVGESGALDKEKLKALMETAGVSQNTQSLLLATPDLPTLYSRLNAFEQAMNQMDQALTQATMCR